MKADCEVRAKTAHTFYLGIFKIMFLEAEELCFSISSSQIMYHNSMQRRMGSSSVTVLPLKQKTASEPSRKHTPTSISTSSLLPSCKDSKIIPPLNTHTHPPPQLKLSILGRWAAFLPASFFTDEANWKWSGHQVSSWIWKQNSAFFNYLSNNPWTPQHFCGQQNANSLLRLLSCIQCIIICHVGTWNQI